MALTGLTLPAVGVITAADSVTVLGTTYHFQYVKLDLGGNGNRSPLIRGQFTLAEGIPISPPSDWFPVLGAGAALIGTVKVADAGGAQLDYNASISSAQTSVAATIAAGGATLLNQNAGRFGASIFNDSTADLYVLLANQTVSISVFTLKMVGGSYFELPMMKNGCYRGIIKGIWSAATGNARVTEFT